MLSYSRARRMVLPTLALTGALILAGGPAVAGGGHHDHKVEICHKPGTPAEQTLVVAKAAVKAHIKHGDVLGACPVPEPEPTPEPTVGPEPEPTPTIEPEPEPTPDPEPTVEPTPEPTLDPEPEVTPEPDPTQVAPEPVEPTAPIDTTEPALGPATSYTIPDVGVRMPQVETLAETGDEVAWWVAGGGALSLLTGVTLLARRAFTRQEADL